MDFTMKWAIASPTYYPGKPDENNISGRPTEFGVRFLRSMRTLFITVPRDFIWSIDFESNNLKEVIAYLRDFGGTTEKQYKISCLKTKSPDVFRITLPDGYNRNIILIIKERQWLTHLNNARAHNIYFSANNQMENTRSERRWSRFSGSAEG